MNIDGKYVSENARMALLRKEEAQLGLWSLEYPNASLVSARLVQILPQKAAQTSGQEAPSQVAAQNPHQEPAHSPHIGESGLHELIEFASLATVMG